MPATLQKVIDDLVSRNILVKQGKAHLPVIHDQAQPMNQPWVFWINPAEEHPLEPERYQVYVLCDRERPNMVQTTMFWTAEKTVQMNQELGYSPREVDQMARI